MEIINFIIWGIRKGAVLVRNTRGEFNVVVWPMFITPVRKTYAIGFKYLSCLPLTGYHIYFTQRCVFCLDIGTLASYHTLPQKNFKEICQGLNSIISKKKNSLLFQHLRDPVLVAFEIYFQRNVILSRNTVHCICVWHMCLALPSCHEIHGMMGNLWCYCSILIRHSISFLYDDDTTVWNTSVVLSWVY